jgi:hypothetical protein
MTEYGEKIIRKLLYQQEIKDMLGRPQNLIHNRYTKGRYVLFFSSGLGREYARHSAFQQTGQTLVYRASRAEVLHQLHASN